MRLDLAKLRARFAVSAGRAVVAFAAVVLFLVIPRPAPPLAAALTWYGVYRTMEDKIVKDDSSWTGDRIESTGIAPPQVDSDRVAIVQGERFGFGFALSGPPAGRIVHLRWVRLFPAPGAPVSGEGARRVREEQELAFAVRQKDLFLGYRIDRPEDEMPGTWAFQLWDGDRELIAKSFLLAPPAGAKPQRMGAGP